ncbi:unnamed protein product [Ceratitis capitata]|uniref:(Mediterranean fruit fly) hypothetical protein n=1 Tax=Ceratitis capitata TaxID=7213 RepID=A0A811UF48_CERCA|nr:unnamed protein product [Ceratitis capitata]
MGVGIAVAPVALWHSSTKFYGTYSGTCFPLHIQEPYPLGWQYSAFIFLGVNLFLLLMIALLYTALLISIWRTRKATPLSLLDCEFAVRFFFIVLTDVLCWAPIIAVKIWVFFNYNISGKRNNNKKSKGETKKKKQKQSVNFIILSCIRVCTYTHILVRKCI